jgi:hypothetical protein
MVSLLGRRSAGLNTACGAALTVGAAVLRNNGFCQFGVGVLMLRGTAASYRRSTLFMPLFPMAMSVDPFQVVSLGNVVRDNRAILFDKLCDGCRLSSLTF